MIIKELTHIKELNFVKTGNYYTSFDGLNEHINLGLVDIIPDGNLTGSWSFWVRTNSTPINSVVYGSYGGGGTPISPLIVVDTAGFIIFFLDSSGIGAANRKSSISISDDNWHHVACVFVGSTSMNIYIDGVLRNGAFGGGSVPASMPASPNITSIGSTDGVQSFFTGFLDEISVYTSALTAPDVTTIFNKTQNNPDYSSISGIAAHYRLDTLNPLDIINSNDGLSVAMDTSNIIELI